MLKRYVHGIGSDDPLVSYDGSGTTSPIYLLADERGSIMAETNSSGLVTTKHQYGPYGEPINQSASRFRYTGQILLPGTELYHYKARVYHPKLGRFLQTDPIGYKDGMNWYAYVGNDPMNAVDPDGKSLKLLKAAFNIAKRMFKGESGKGAIKNEIADVVDNVQTLSDGQVGLDDVVAVVDLATGFGKEAGTLVGAASSGLQKAEALRDAALGDISKLSKTQQSKITTVVGAHDPATGRVAVGIKETCAANAGKCAEDLASEALGNPETIEFTKVIRPRNGQTIPRCERCSNTYGAEN